MISDYLICPEPVERASRERLEAMPVQQFMSAFIK
jgi:hypothetical protein